MNPLKDVVAMMLALVGYGAVVVGAFAVHEGAGLVALGVVALNAAKGIVDGS